MKIKNILKSLIFIVSLNFTATSCADWLKVDMEDGIMEDKLFSEDEGFFTVLNGVYSSLNESYGDVLSMGVIDVMAQYYNVPANGTHPYKVFARTIHSNLFQAWFGNICTAWLPTSTHCWSTVMNREAPSRPATILL
jgi:hypothetical protein